jgi:hypothetical protein
MTSTLTVTHTRVHAFVVFADPYLTCDRCGAWVEAWHDNDSCGCSESFWNEPCGHERTGVTSACPSWGPVDGCQCLPVLGHVPHGQPPTTATETP